MNDFDAAKQCFFEGLRLLQAGDFPEAELQFARSLELLPERVSTLNNLSAVKIKLNKFDEAEEMALKAIRLESTSAEAWSNLAIALSATERHEEALPASERAIDCNPTNALAWLAKAKILIELQRFQEALPACEQALKLEPDKYEILYHQSVIFEGLERPEDARTIYRKALDLRAAHSPVYIGRRSVTQKASALIINRIPNLDDSLVSFENLSRRVQNYPGQLADQLHEDFHFDYAFAAHLSEPSARQKIPPPDFIVNNHVNGEVILEEGNLPGLIELFDSFGVPVVNHPSKAIQSTRDASVELLEGVPGLVAPKTMRFYTVGKEPGELALDIEAHFEYPLITRSLTAQMGRGMTLVESRQMLLKVLSGIYPHGFFVTQFIDARRGNDFYRKIRAAVVGPEITIVRVDYSTHWNVHGRKAANRVPFYLENIYLLEEEKRICANPEATLGRSAVQSLQSLRERIPMDVFGIDFAVDSAGLVIFYEANATMNLFSTAQKEVPNPKEAGEKLKLAFQSYFTSLLKSR